MGHRCGVICRFAGIRFIAIVATMAAFLLGCCGSGGVPSIDISDAKPVSAMECNPLANQGFCSPIQYRMTNEGASSVTIIYGKVNFYGSNGGKVDTHECELWNGAILSLKPGSSMSGMCYIEYIADGWDKKTIEVIATEVIYSEGYKPDECWDGIDNDFDGAFDKADPDC